MARRTVAVVGGGCAGVLTARELLSHGGADVVLVEPGEPGGGLAYGTARPWHLLNSRAGAMSADPDDPGHFLRWSGAPSPDAFLPRDLYGRYLRAVFDEAAAAHPGRLDVRPGRVLDVRPGADGCTLVLADGGRLRADEVVLAVGNPAPARPAGLRHPRLVADPWAPGALDGVPAGEPVLLVGTGLTAVDVALTLTAVPRSAPVVAVSRRGLLPLAHTPVAAPPLAPDLDDCATLRDVVRVVRATARAAGDWRPVVDGMRPALDRLWVALSRAEQEAFLRHLARPWECHRHRMAPQVATRIAGLRAAGLLEVHGGGVRPTTDARTLQLADGPRTFGAVVNCAGPGPLPAAAGPLVGVLLAAGVVRVGPHRLGLDVDPDGRLVAADGTVHPRLRLVGPLRRGALWETTAVPEIRAQARRLAAGPAEPAADPLLAPV